MNQKKNLHVIIQVIVQGQWKILQETDSIKGLKLTLSHFIHQDLKWTFFFYEGHAILIAFSSFKKIASCLNNYVRSDCGPMSLFCLETYLFCSISILYNFS